ATRGSSAASPELTPSPPASPAREKDMGSSPSEAVNVWPDTDTEDDFEERRNLQAPLSEAKAASITTASLGVASRSSASNGSP
ncbi:March7, partial [Symbiodinium sp. CCMP2592]